MSEGETEAEKPFAAERAKTGRAKCKKCKCPIEKDTVRIAKLVANPFADGKMKAWHHPSCLFEVFARQRATTKRIDDPEEDISGWQDLCDDDKETILKKMEELEDSSPFKNAKTAIEPADANKRKATPSDLATGKKCKSARKHDSVSSNREEGRADASGSNKKPEKAGKWTRDDRFEEFQRLCNAVAGVDAYTDKTAIVRKMLADGSEGDGFKSDVKLWCRMLLPGAVKRIYKLQSKQLVKLFSRILLEDEDKMLEHLEQGDVAETVSLFFGNNADVKAAEESVLTIQEVDQFLETLSELTREDEQIRHFRSILSRCTADDLKMIVRLIKHDLRINAGPKHILSAVHEDAYRAFQASRDLNTVVDRCLRVSSKSGKRSSDIDARLSLMTPVLPMLAEACKSVEMAMKKCPRGMLAEVKYDGERVQVHKKGSEFRYFSRSLKPVLSHKVALFKDFIPIAFPGGDDLILDSEVLMIDTKTGQPLPFGSLGVHKKSEFKDANVCLFVFDCIYYNGQALLHKSTTERRRILTENMVEIPNRIMLSEVEEVHNPQDLAKMIGKVLRLGLEGLVLKDVHSKYEPGKRHWLKVKKDYLYGGAMADSADLVVLGAWYGTGNKGGMMSVFLMGCYDEDRDVWLTVTKVHTGHDDATLEKLQDELDMVKIGKDPGKLPRWLRANKPMIPDFVAKDPKKQPVWEITGAEFTNQGVHTADGISIRFPRVTRIREDKHWSTATNLNELRNLFKQKADSIDFSLLLPEIDEKRTAEQSSPLDPTTKGKERSKSPFRMENDFETPKASSSAKKCRVKSEDRFVHADAFVSSKKCKKHKIDVSKDEEEEEEEGEKKKKKERAEFYAFVNKDFVEYSATGSPLNWIEGRRPQHGLPSDAKPLSDFTDAELMSKSILRGAAVGLAPGFDDNARKYVRNLLKTLGGKPLKDRQRFMAEYFVHPCKEIPSSAVREFQDVPKSARHVSISWLEASASSWQIQRTEEHAVQLKADYCLCPCPHRS